MFDAIKFIYRAFTDGTYAYTQELLRDKVFYKRLSNRYYEEKYRLERKVEHLEKLLNDIHEGGIGK